MREVVEPVFLCKQCEVSKMDTGNGCGRWSDMVVTERNNPFSEAVAETGSERTDLMVPPWDPA